MKKITLLFALLLSMQALVAQDWMWENKIESATGTKVEILDITANYQGSGGAGVLYAVGTFTGTLSFGGSYSAVAGSQDGFIAQFDYSGNLNWISPFGGTGLDGATGVVSDIGGNIYVTGYYTLQFCSYDTYKAEFGLKKLNGSSLSTLTPITANSSTILSQEKVPFIAKFNRNGQAQWANLVEATEGEGTATALAPSNDGSFNTNGDVYLTGFFKENLSYPGAGGGVYVPSTFDSYQKTFVAKYSTMTGNIVWANYIDNTPSSLSENVGTDITVEANNGTYNGDVFISGYYKGDATLNHHSASSLTLYSNTTYNGLIAKLNQTNGEWMWAEEIYSHGDEYATSISCYPAGGEVYISGYYPADYTLTCEAVSGTSPTVSGVGGTDIFTAKYTSAGACSWVNSYGGSYNDYGTEIDAFKYDVATLYIAGMYTESATFNSESLTGVSGETDHYLAKIDRGNGNTIWVESIDASEKGTGSFEGIFNGPKITYDINAVEPIFISGTFKGADMPTFVNTLGTPVQAGYIAAHRDCSCPAVKNVSVVRSIGPPPITATVSWDNPNYQACISSYDIMYTEQVSPFIQQDDPGYPYGTTNSNPIAVTPNPYEWVVITNCSTGQSNADPVIAKTGETKKSTAKSNVVVTEGINTSNEVSVYPNPAKDKVTITTTFADASKGINSIEVNNILGQRVKTLSFSSRVKNFDLPLDGLENGVYTVTVTSGADQHTFKIVKE